MHRHGYKGRKLSLEKGPRTALVRGMLTSLVMHEAMTTTEAKAKEVAPRFEKLVTKAKKGDLHSQRQLRGVLLTEVAAQKLSYLTFSGVEEEMVAEIASHFNSPYINTIVNTDILGVQYAAVLKNIYALGAGIANGLGYGDNFQSVLIANSGDEMAMFLRRFGAKHIVVGEHETTDIRNTTYANYAASVYLGDLLVTCYSLYSRNRTFGSMIGKGYSVQVAKLELKMEAEGYNASKCIYNINQKVKANMPIAETIYKILWEDLSPAEGFEIIESVLI